MNGSALGALIAATAMLSACADDARNAEETDLSVATTQSERQALDDALPAGDFSDLTLGAKVVGPRGPQVEGAMSNAVGNFADIRSYVACPQGMERCDPASAPAGTIFTYVHVVTPGEDNDPETGGGKGADESHVERATAFRMTMPAHGFTGAAGYAKAEALAAMGSGGNVVITCDDGMIVWTLNSGDGGDQWEHREPVTFYWQSTLPPAGPARAYEIRANYAAATGEGPYPRESETATNACATDAG